MNKKGASLSSFTIAALFSLGFIVIASLMFASMNSQYGENINYGFNDTTGSFQKFIDYQDTAAQSVANGQVSLGGISGISLTSIGTLFFGIINILGIFINGSYIYQAIHSLNLGKAGDTFGIIFQIVYVLTLWVFIPIYIFLFRKT